MEKMIEKKRGTRSASLFGDWKSLRKEPTIEVKKTYFVNASGRSMDAFPEGTKEAAERIGTLIKWHISNQYESDDGWDIYESAHRDGEGILSRYPGATVLCQGSWGYALALAKYIKDNGGHPVYVETVPLSKPEVKKGYKNRILSFREYEFPDVDLNVPKREWNPDQLLINLTSHPSGYGQMKC